MCSGISSSKYPQLMLAQDLDLEAGGLLGKKRLIKFSNLSCMFQPRFHQKALFSGKWVMGAWYQMVAQFIMRF